MPPASCLLPILTRKLILHDYLAFIGLCVYSILLELIPAEQVTSDIIKGGICVYFLLGFFWAAAYNIIQIFDPDSFSSAAKTVNQADLLHFSFTTLATVGTISP